MKRKRNNLLDDPVWFVIALVFFCGMLVLASCVLIEKGDIKSKVVGISLLCFAIFIFVGGIIWQIYELWFKKGITNENCKTKGGD